MKKPKRQFEIGQDVETDLYGTMRIVAFWCGSWTYSSPTGNWVYRLAFLTKKGLVDKRKNFRQFDEQRLQPLTQSTPS
jgi:hypothetical protein